jgi:transcriptional regulator with XRE-family HTH domain
VPNSKDARLESAQRLLGLRLRETRMRAGMTLPEVSASTGLSMGHLSDCERGRSIPSLTALLAMADAYEVLVTDLLTAVYPFGSSSKPRRLPLPPVDGRTARHDVGQL